MRALSIHGGRLCYVIVTGSMILKETLCMAEVLGMVSVKW